MSLLEQQASKAWRRAIGDLQNPQTLEEARHIINNPELLREQTSPPGFGRS